MGELWTVVGVYLFWSGFLVYLRWIHGWFFPETDLFHIFSRRVQNWMLFIGLLLALPLSFGIVYWWS